MKKLLLASIFFTFAITVPMPATAGAGINAGISLPPPIVFTVPPDVIAMPDASGVYVVADADEDVPQGGPTRTDERQQDQSVEKGKATGPEYKSDWKINVWPVRPPDNVKTPHEMKEENKHTPPDRFN
jgi:hypothetical protein